MAFFLAWNGTADARVTSLAVAWQVGNTPAAGDVNVVGQGVTVRCNRGGHVEAAPAPGPGTGQDGGGNTWTMIGPLSRILLTNLGSDDLFVDGFSDKQAGDVIPAGQELELMGRSVIDPSQVFVWTTGASVAWCALGVP